MSKIDLIIAVKDVEASSKRYQSDLTAEVCTEEMNLTYLFLSMMKSYSVFINGR